MPEPDAVTPSPPAELADDALAIIGSYALPRQAHEAGLAVLAAGQPYWVQPSDGRYLLAVVPDHAERLKREVEIAASRNRFWPPPSLDLPSPATSKAPAAVAALFLIAVFWAQESFTFIRDIGANSVEAVLEGGEWWRLATAATLHADLGHLIGNLLGLTVFAYLCSRHMGHGLAWTLIVACACLANLTNDLIRVGQEFFSLGASTAVFAALGAVTGFPAGVAIRAKRGVAKRDWLIPLCGGSILLAWIGGGEPPVDIGGHLWSFLFGLAAAIAIAYCRAHARLSGRTQERLLAVAALFPLVAWTFALVNAT